MQNTTLHLERDFFLSSSLWSVAGMAQLDMVVHLWNYMKN